jgi:hypothetical protein
MQKETARREKKAASVYVEMSDEDDTMETIPEEENEEEGEKQPRQAGAKGKEAANGRTKKAMVVSDSDSDFRLEEDDTDYEEAIPKKGSKKPAVECCLVYGCRGYELKTHIPL